MKVYYWSPFISKVATVNAVLNSIISIKKFSKKKIDLSIINVFKEWDFYNEEIKKNQIECINLNGLLNIRYLPKKGFLKSRFTYFITFMSSLLSLHNLLKKQNPDFLLIHLISSIPLFLIIFFNYKTNFILRVSGYPKLNLIRRFFWKTAGKKIDKIFCPTQLTKDFLIKEKIFSEKKIFLVPDPIIETKKIKILLKKKFVQNDNFLNNTKYVISIGRLSKQKNFNFLIDNFKIVAENNNIKLVIIGKGEQKNFLLEKIKKLNLQEKVLLIGNRENIYPYLAGSLFFVLTSDWEDPGFVIVEAMFSRKLILSSDCPNGPREIIQNLQNGFLYKQNNFKDFEKKFKDVLHVLNNKEKKNFLLLNALKKTRNYTIFNHYLEIKKHLE